MNRKHIIRQLRNRGIQFDPNLSTKELQTILNSYGGSQNNFTHVLDYAGGRGRIQVAFNASDDTTPAEIMICEDIGRDAWTGEGIGIKDIRATLDTITPKTRPLDFLINSPGGSVTEGAAIRNLLDSWAGRITKNIIGIAASTASWCIPADETRAYKSSQMFLHRSFGMVVGNADDMRAAIQFLETTDKQISDIYADDSGGDAGEFMDLMKAETLLTGQQALDLGLVDKLIDGDAKNTFTPEWLNSAKQKLAALNSLRSATGTDADAGRANNTNHNQTENMKQKIALLNKRGITVPENAAEAILDSLIAASDAMRAQNKTILDGWNVAIPADATDAQIVQLISNGKPAPAPARADGSPLSAEDKLAITELRNQLAASRKRDIRNRLEHFASAEGGHLIPVNQIEDWETEALAVADGPEGNRILNNLAKLPRTAPGVPALSDIRVDIVNGDIKDVTRKFESFNEVTKAWQRGNSVGHGSVTDMEAIRNAAVAKANFFRQVRNRLIEVMNTNTIAAELKRQVILQDVVIRDFARRVIGLNLFSTVFRDIPLQGLNTVEVPYYDLDTSASTSFVSGTGYTTIGNTVTDKREITVGEGAQNGDRLFQALSFSSQEIARQPYLKVAELAGLKAEKLAFDIWQDILSIVTAANYGAAAVTSADIAFDSDNIADLKLACKAWPDMGRGLLLDSNYDANLLKDPSFKYALNAASDSAIKEGKLFPRVMGFDYAENPNIPDNGENLKGFAVFKYAILVAFAPVPPVEEVRNAGTVWEMIIDPATGVTLEYRRFGNNVTDAATNVIESSYGFAKGLGTGLKRIVAP